LSGYSIARVLYCQGTLLPGYSIARVLYCQGTLLPGYSIARVLYCPAPAYPTCLHGTIADRQTDWKPGFCQQKHKKHVIWDLPLAFRFIPTRQNTNAITAGTIQCMLVHTHTILSPSITSRQSNKQSCFNPIKAKLGL
jgi:hypothetical protein